jgi:hypothetical protein
MNHYHLFKEKVKLLAKKYVFGEQFIDYIDKKDFFQEDEKRVISIELTNEILLNIDNNIRKTLDQINSFIEYSKIGDIYCLWKIIYIKYFNPIIIIGSGVSGLTIASGLSSLEEETINSFRGKSSPLGLQPSASGLDNDNFLILEARDRIGGRVYTSDKNNLDMGAAWMHGLKNNPLNNFVDINKLIPVANSNPWMHSENILIKYLNKFEISEEKRQTISKKWTEIASKISNIENKTILEAFKEINGYSEEKENETDNFQDEEILYSFLYMIEVWCGGSVKNISTSFLTDINNKQSLFGDYDGSHCIFKDGAKTLIDGIIKSSKNNILEKIRYNEVVTDIIYNDYYVKVQTNKNIYYCNKVCITVPPGPLKDINFSPPLSEQKKESLSKIKMGSYKKIQLEFNEEDIFWNSDIPMFLTYDPKINKYDFYLEEENKMLSGLDILRDCKPERQDIPLGCKPERQDIPLGCKPERQDIPLGCKPERQDIPYILWNNYKYSKNKPIIEAICPAEIGWKLTGKTDEEIIDLILSQLENYFPNMPEPKA